MNTVQSICNVSKISKIYRHIRFLIFSNFGFTSRKYLSAVLEHFGRRVARTGHLAPCLRIKGLVMESEDDVPDLP